MGGSDSTTGISFTGLRFVRRGDLGRLVVILALVALMKLVLAILRRDVGRALRILCEYGTALVGAGSFWEPMVES